MKQYEVWLANLNPQRGTVVGKVRPVVIVQSDLLNDIEHHSTIICPITSNVISGFQFLRVNLKTDFLETDSDILVDQIRAVDNRKFIAKLGKLNEDQISKLSNYFFILKKSVKITTLSIFFNITNILFNTFNHSKILFHKRSKLNFIITHDCYILLF